MKLTEFIHGIEAFEKFESRDAMYKVATFLVSHFWGDYSNMADGLGVLLLTWNAAFYRYGTFNFDNLQKTIENNFSKIKYFRERDISTLKESDYEDVRDLFEKFREALKSVSNNTKSPVAVAKALHLLAPNFFPLWDKRISQAYKCNYQNDPAGRYILFSEITKEIAKEVSEYKEVKDIMKKENKTLLKLIDEYNYSKYTQQWI